MHIELSRERVLDLAPGDFFRGREILGLQADFARQCGWVPLRLDAAVAACSVETAPAAVGSGLAAPHDLADEFLESFLLGVAIGSDSLEIDGHAACASER